MWWIPRGFCILESKSLKVSCNVLGLEDFLRLGCWILLWPWLRLVLGIVLKRLITLISLHPVCWSSSSITYLSPLEGHCFSRSIVLRNSNLLPNFYCMLQLIYVCFKLVMHVVILCCFKLCIWFYIRSRDLQSLCCVFDCMPDQNGFFLSYLMLVPVLSIQYTGKF